MSKTRNNKGQAIFEFVLFVPFMLLFYSACLNIFGAINGSINQQKITRGYFFNSIKGNSTVPDRQALSSYVSSGIESAGMMAIGWRENPFSSGEASGTTPKAPCYKMTSLAAPTSPDECGDAQDDPGPTSFIRVKTVFGVCGASYGLQNAQLLPSPVSSNDGACTLQ